MIHTKVELECDGCGNLLKTPNGTTEFTFESFSIESALLNGWTIEHWNMTRPRHYCPDCKNEPL